MATLNHQSETNTSLIRQDIPQVYARWELTQVQVDRVLAWSRWEFFEPIEPEVTNFHS